MFRLRLLRFVIQELLSINSDFLTRIYVLGERENEVEEEGEDETEPSVSVEAADVPYRAGRVTFGA